jgi:hypothetical protein
VIFNNEGNADSENLARALEKTRDECGVLGGRLVMCHLITNDKYSMANSQFPAGSNTSWFLWIENWSLKIGHWLLRRLDLSGPAGRIQERFIL